MFADQGTVFGMNLDVINDGLMKLEKTIDEVVSTRISNAKIEIGAIPLDHHNHRLLPLDVMLIVARRRDINAMAVYAIAIANSDDVLTTIQTDEINGRRFNVDMFPSQIFNEKEIKAFTATVLADTEDVWEKIFKENNLGTYQKPTLVLFTDAVQTACGNASSAVGPFYCPGDHKLYMDMSFFEELRTRFGAKGGDFAIAYVMAHEVGHHIQTLLGTSQKVHQAQQRLSQKEANKLSVSLELQADFYAGVWAHYDKQYLDADDIEEAVSAANAVGDDAIQKRMQGQVVPDSFTHGTSKQRVYWFMKGYETGDINQGNTFE